MTAAITAGVVAIAVTTAPTSAETAVGVEAGVAVGDTSLDAAFVHTLESTLRSQFVGVEVALVRGRLVLSGFATPGVHTAVLAIVSNMLQHPVRLPAGVGVVSPDLGLDLPFLGAAAGIELPDLGRVIRMLGVVDRIQIIR